MGIFSKNQRVVPDSTVYQEGADSRFQNSRVYLLTIIAYLGIFLFGYDTGVAGGIVSTAPFQRDFKYSAAFYPDLNDKQLAKKQADIASNVVSLLQVGAFFGALGSAPITQRIGRKWALMLGTIVFTIGAILQTVPKGGASSGLALMYSGRVVSGLGVGLMSTVCPTYVSELAPKNVRGRITGLFQIVVVIGVAFSYWIEYAISVSAMKSSSASWRIPIAFQIVPSGLMILLLPLIKESPRWLVSRGRDDEALANLAWARKRGPEDPRVLEEFAEIAAAHQEEVETTSGTSWRECWAPGMRIRFFIAFAMFFLQQWAGQNSISYYAPTIFKSIGLQGTSTGLLASGIYGIVKIVATSIFIFVGIERFGRRLSLGFGASFMSMFLLIIGAIFITHVPDAKATHAAPASIAMAAMIYCFVIPYCFSWGPVPWVYCSEIFPMRLRHYGMAVAAATQWAFNFTLTKITPYLVLDLPNGKLFFMFAGVNVLSAAFGFWLPETRGLSIEEMDILFGSTTQDARDRYVAAQHKQQEAQHGSLRKEEIDHKEHV
ncbi:putative high-affinity glucose transporter of the major facilitator superfamily [Mrakia frigida]|uniref:sugar porter family MFS transporter n=1 Tax=Mrakia frigida TaxID=29902 RepID=UPI003FCC1329